MVLGKAIVVGSFYTMCVSFIYEYYGVAASGVLFFSYVS